MPGSTRSGPVAGVLAVAAFRPAARELAPAHPAAEDENILGVPDRYALIAAAPDDGDAADLATILADPGRGDFTVEHTDDPDGVARFLADRAPTDEVLIHTAGTPVDLATCRAARVLVLTEDERTPLEADAGRAVIAGAPTRAVVRALRAGRADRDANGEVTARELYDRMRHTLELTMRSGLDAPFVVSRTRRPQEATRRDRRERLQLTWRLACVLAAAAGLLAALALPWYFGGTGLEYAFGDGTAWPNRVAPLVCLGVALVSAAYPWHRRGGGWVAILAAIALGATAGLFVRFVEPDVGPGVPVVFLALALLLTGLTPAIRERSDSIGCGCVGGAIVAYQVVGPLNWVWVVLGAAALGGGAWALARR